PSMDSFFKAAVCDLDKLLDDFELNTEELDCKSVFLKPSVYPFSSLGPQCLSSEASTVPSNLPDLNSLHYGSATSCPDRSGTHNHSAEDREVKGQPLTAVDLLSSVDHGPAKSSAPPCPDRALKPVCDLVNDTSSAILVRANSHDAFSELDVAEKQMEEEQQQQQQEEAGGGGGDGGWRRCLWTLTALWSLHMHVVERGNGGRDATEERASVGKDEFLGLNSHEQSGEYSASLSLLDVILPAAVEKSGESTDESAWTTDIKDTTTSENKEDESQEASDKDEAEAPVGLNSGASGQRAGRLILPAHSCVHVWSSGELKDHRKVAEGRMSPEGQHLSPEPAAAPSADCRPSVASRDNPLPSPVDPPEFGFEYLPESDQAEMLVTDEELDAFLQAHSEAEQGGGVSYCGGSAECFQPESLSELNGDLEGSRVEELRSCGREGLEDLAKKSQNHPPGRATPRPATLSTPSTAVALISRPPMEGRDLNSYTAKLPDLHQQGKRAARRKEAQTSSGSTKGPAGDQESSPTSPGLTEDHSNIRDLSPIYATQEHQDYSVGYDELSEPPPYPGEPTAEGARSVSWKREGAEDLGSRQPAWVPDSEAPNCMNCDQRFTFTRRRHHCRACGKVYCAVCCNRKCKLKYLEKEARVCIVCFDTIHRAQALERMMSPAGPSPNPNIPSEYCSTIPPLQQARAAGTLNSPPPTVMVPVSVLKNPNNDSCPREQKRVWFADGILPNGEVADTTKLSVTSRRSSQEFSGSVSPDQTTPGSGGSEVGVGGSSAPEASGTVEVVRPPVSGPWDYALLSGIGSSVKRVPSLLPDNEDELPPLLITTGEDEAGGDVLVEESPAPCQILHLLEDGGPRPLTFVLNANLLVNVKLITYGSRQCWCFGSNGLQALGQRELVFLLECLPEEKALPRDLFTLYLNIYQEAQKGKFLEELDNVTFTSSFLGSKDHAGMLFFSPTCQPLDGLTLPPQPFLCGLLIQKLEVPWAKVFPLRLLLRLGAEYSVYPTTLTSVRFRDSVYRETGHTIMNLLADLRNYQYSLSVVEGLRIHMEMGHSYIDIPKGSFSEMQKVVNASNEHVISIGARFSSEADSHLVCFQNEEGNYQTQASSKPGQTRTVTGASFVVFNGALKASSGFIAKSSIVEDGLMVQIPPETMESLRSALREQTDFHIPCGRNDGGEVRENVTVRWVDWSSPVNTGKTSGVDGRPLDGVRSVRMQQDAEFESDGRAITCTEVFYQLKTPDCNFASVLSSCSVFQREMALAACSALTPHLAVLTSCGINSLTLRISTQADMVEYQAGSGGRLLPQRYMNELDGALIPVIHGGGASMPQTAMDMEFIFYITNTI
ncbi:hypothetical protein L3Q82_012745, partial [Scortum barcoo]